MGLRCLIGHEYGEPETSRDRNQRGNEVVVTEREYRECTRCGHRRIISENKEVTTEATAGEPEEPSAEASWSEAPESDDQATVDSFARSAAPGGAAPDESMSAADDDGIILDDEPEAPPERGHGEWPAAGVGDEESSGEPDPWPDEAATEEPASPGEDPLDAGPEPTGASDDAEESSPEAPAAEAEGSPEAADAPTDEPTAEPEPARSPRPDNRNTEFVCPDCGETWPSRNASLRPGDICPECRKGYLDERVVQ